MIRRTLSVPFNGTGIQRNPFLERKKTRKSTGFGKVHSIYKEKGKKEIIDQGLTQTSGLFETLGAPGEVGGQGPGQQGRPVRRQAAQPGNNALQPRNILCWAPDEMV